MRTTNFLLSTLREEPNEAEVMSHRLMLRAGMIHKLVSGIYTWLPLGLRVLRKVEQIIREEMEKVNALELLMPSVQPAEPWLATGRWELYGDQLLKMRDRNGHEICLAPTHEEVITTLAKQVIRSYKQLPIIFYQLHTKFRDELRPRFGVMRSREFLMKDGYSFHLTSNSMHETYEQLYQAYNRIFTRLGLKFKVVMADSGAIGGSRSHEFQVLADSGEDLIAYSDQSDYAANLELAKSYRTERTTDSEGEPLPLEKIATPGVGSIEEVAKFFGVSLSSVLKTLVVKGKQVPWVAIVLRGDHELNVTKVGKLAEIFAPLTFANPEELQQICGCVRGSIGPLGSSLPLVVDYEALAMQNFICGANEAGYHYRNGNWGAALPAIVAGDLRNVVEGDRSPDGQGRLRITRGIEVGHIFELGQKYTKALQVTVLNEQGKSTELYMGCYGIGVSRVVAAAIEQCGDQRGIVWPTPLAPFTLVIIPLGYSKSLRIREVADRLYEQFQGRGVEVLLDDRSERAGVLFKDMDLIGIPHRIVVSEKNLEMEQVEYQQRRNEKTELINLTEVVAWVDKQIKTELES